MEELLPVGWSITVNRKGEVVIYTNCRKDDDGELVSLEEEEDDEPSFGDEDTVPLEDEDDDEE